MGSESAYSPGNWTLDFSNGVPDGGFVIEPAGLMPGGTFRIDWTAQDGFNCNADLIELLADGNPVVSWTLQYANCGSQSKTQTFTLAPGNHVMTVHSGCCETCPGNGNCVVSVRATITRLS